MNRIYIAAPWSQRTTAKAVRDIFARFDIACTSHWLDFDGDSSDHRVLAREAAVDYEDVFNAEALLLLNLPGGHGGKDVEMGLALAWNIPVIVVGHATNVFHHHPRVTVVPNADQALQVILGLK